MFKLQMPSSLSSFKTQFSKTKRALESSRILSKYPDRRPIICERAHNQPSIPNIDRNKYLVPVDLTVGQFVYVVRQRLKLSSEQALFFNVDGEIPSSTETILNLYERHKDCDNFLYITYMAENTFGCMYGL
jgi:GABA(A) receptor-associated protein